VRGFAALITILIVVAGSAEAGIVILQNKGQVIVGRIEEDDVKGTTITVHSPRTKEDGSPLPGVQTFSKSEIRWFDRDADHPTDAYFEKFLDEPLDLHWQQYREDYIERKKFVPPVPSGDSPSVISRLSPIALVRRLAFHEVAIRKPLGWSVTESGGILMAVSDDGRARIHVYGSDLGGDHALDVAHAALERLGARFASEKKTETGVEWVTEMPHRGHTVRAFRKIVQTAASTAFAVAYVEDRDMDTLEPLVRASLATFEVRQP
jgi:hypothetical protein